MRLLLAVLLLIPLQLSAAPKKSKSQLEAEAQRQAFMKAPTQADKDFDKQFQSPSAPQAVETKPKLKFTAKKVSSSKTTSTDWSTSYGSSDKTSTQAGAVEIEILNMDAAPLDITLDVFFLSASRTICDWSRQSIKLEPSQAKTLTVESRPVKRRDLNLQALGVHESEGKVLTSWVARLRQGDRVIDVRASTNPIETLGRDTAAITKLCERWKNEKRAEGWPEQVLKTYE